MANSIVRIANDLALKVRPKLPTILMAIGATGVVASGGLLVRQTLKVQPILTKHQERIDEVRDQMVTPTYSEKDRGKDLTRAYVRAGLDLSKHYGPTVTLGMASLAAILTSHGILRKENMALVATCKALESSFREYRKRVIEVVGEEAELDIYRDIREVEVTDEETGEKTTMSTIGSSGSSIYSRFFDEGSVYWSKTPEFNLLFLRGRESRLNDLLQSRGHLFLNEVYTELGLETTQVGQHAGWRVDGDGDGYIDFGMYDLNSPQGRAFVNGHERSILLDFNVDGSILHSLKN